MHCRAHKLPLTIPYPVFWLAAWVYALAEWIAAMKPAPMRIAELACSFQQSQASHATRGNCSTACIDVVKDARAKAYPLATHTCPSSAPTQQQLLCVSGWILQVLFSIVRLGIPDALSSGSKTAAELAAAIGPSTNSDWLDRLLSAAAVLGMLTRSKVYRSVAHRRAAAAAAAATGRV